MATYARDPANVSPTAFTDVEIPPPKRTLEECDKILTAPGQMHEVTEAVIEGRKMKVFKNAPPCLRDVWLAVAQGYAKREYLVLGNERVTYAEAHKRAVIVANMLVKEFGCKKGDHVAIIMRNRPDWVVTFWACQILGCVAVAVNAWLKPEAVAHCLKVSDAVVAIVDEERAKLLTSQMPELRRSNKSKLRAVLVSQAKAPSGMLELSEVMKKYQNATEIPPATVGPEDNCCIFFTSGTTSFPKAVLSTQRAFITNLFTSTIAPRRAALRKGDQVVEIAPEDPQKVLLLPVPLFHVTGCTSLLFPATAVGGRIIFMHKWTQKEGLRLCKTEGVTSTGGIPFVAQELLEGANNDELKTLEQISYGGAPANDGLPRLQSKKAPLSLIGQAYGLSETNAVVVAHCGEDYSRRPLSTGLPSYVNEIKIVGPDNKEVKTGEPGEIWIRGPNVFKEYYNDAKATAAALTRDGWFKSGDIGSVDHEGFLYIRDRAKDIIIRGGENIAATSVENALFKNPNVQDCAVVGVSDKRLGELPAAVVVIRPNAIGKVTEEQIIEDTRQYLPKHEVPVMVMLREPKDANDDSGLRIERNANGKIVKNELKKVVEKEWQRRTRAKL